MISLTFVVNHTINGLFLGQLSLAQCSVLIVGAGGLGCPAAIYLAAAGIGKCSLGLINLYTQ